MTKQQWQSLVMTMWLAGLAGCAAKIPVKMTLPAETDLSRFRRVAILRFQGNGGDQLGNALEATLMNAQVNGEPYFTLVSRDRLDQVLQEQKLGTSGLVDDSSAARVGKVLGVDGMIAGSVNEYGTRDRQYSEVREETHDKKTYHVTYNCIERTARIHLNTKFIDTSTTAIAMSVPLQGHGRDQDCQRAGTQLSVIDSNDMLRSATDEMFGAFARKIAPHDVVVNIELREKDDDIGFFGGGAESAKAATEHIKTGVTYAKGGNWSLAISSWEQAAQAHPNSAAAFYDIGVAYEAQGQLEKAREQYRKAAQLRAESLYVQATGTIEKRIRDREAVRRQTEGRPE
ncbi:MAG: tetratricopeptide repeat protein [Deltaproteobacteria bacterium]|nr:tetratricopeptide repeat protein [Deltaproteobacteria bacterium]